MLISVAKKLFDSDFPSPCFDAFGTSKHGKGKSLWKKLFCYTYQYIGEIWTRKKKKVCHIHFKWNIVAKFQIFVHEEFSSQQSFDFPSEILLKCKCLVYSCVSFASSKPQFCKKIDPQRYFTTFNLLIE